MKGGVITLGSITKIRDTGYYPIDSNGMVRISKHSIDSFYFNQAFTYNGILVLDESKLRQCLSIQITINPKFEGEYYFENEKWLFKENNLYTRPSKDGTFDKNAYLEKSKLSDLKYKDVN